MDFSGRYLSRIVFISPKITEFPTSSYVNPFFMPIACQVAGSQVGSGYYCGQKAWEFRLLWGGTA
jgi:hypothetical protein